MLSAIKLVATLAAVALLAAACTSGRRQAQPPAAQEPAPPPVTLPQTATPTTQVPNTPPPAQPDVTPPVVQVNPDKARQAAPLAEAVKSYYANTNCYPEMSQGGTGMPVGLKRFLDEHAQKVSWPSGFVYETQTRAMGWQLGKGTVYYVAIYYPGNTPAWNGPGSGRVYIVYDKPVPTC